MVLPTKRFLNSRVVVSRVEPICLVSRFPGPLDPVPIDHLEVADASGWFDLTLLLLRSPHVRAALGRALQSVDL